MIHPNTSRSRLACALGILLLFTTLGRAQQSAALFDAARVVLPSAAPEFQQLIDLDGDAFPDALGMRAGTTSSTDIRIYRNDGSGNFSTAWSHIVNWPAGVVAHDKLPLLVGDFDGDGQRDDFVLSAGLELRLFQGTGTSAAPVLTMGLPEALVDLETADLDFNGSDDLIMIGSGQIGVVLNPLGPAPVVHTAPLGAIPNYGHVMGIPHANGTWSLLASYHRFVLTPGTGLVKDPSWSQPLGLDDLIVGDVDGDGDQDGLALNLGQYRLILQDALGNLSVGPSQTGGPNFGGDVSQLIDLDNDGDLDAVGHDNRRFILSENDGSGSFIRSTTIAGTLAARFAGASDLDGDGDLDLLAGRAIYYGRSSDLIERPGGLTAPQFSVQGNQFRDLDADGDIDVGLTPWNALTNDGRGHYSLTPLTLLGTPPALGVTSAAFLGDWNGDGFPDATMHDGVASYVAWNQGGGSFVWNPAPIATGVASLAVSFGRSAVDLDNDGDLDAIGYTHGLSGGSAHVAFNNGTGSFGSGASFPQERVVGQGDLDGDGLLDLVVVGEGPLAIATSGLMWRRQLAGSSFSAPATISPNLTIGGPALVADLDGDGDLDLMAFCPGFGHQLYSNDGSGGFTETTFLSVVATSPPPEIMAYALTDVTGDGIDDLLLAPSPDAADCCEVHQGNAGGFVPTQHRYAFLPSQTLDLDGDGDADLYDTVRYTSQLNRVVESGLRQQFGFGSPGTSGLIPLLGASGPFREGSVATLRLRNALGGAQAYVALSTISATLTGFPVPGMTAYLNPLAPTTLLLGPLATSGTPGSAGQGSLDLSFPIPTGTAGLQIDQQAFVLDPGAPFGLSSSQALRLGVGL